MAVNGEGVPPVPHTFPGERDHSNIFSFDDGFYYHCVKECTQTLNLRCIRYRRSNGKCFGRATCLLDGDLYAITRFHNHAADRVFEEEMALRRAVLERVSHADPTNFSRMIREVGQRGHYSVHARSRVTLPRMRTPMRNRRMANFPRVPRDLQDLVQILLGNENPLITQTIDNTDNLFAGYCGSFDEETLSIVFLSYRMLTFFETVKKVFADGTFKVRPLTPECRQIFSLSCTWRNHIIVLARIIMQRRTTAAYVVLFNFLRELMPNFSPNIIMCDQEDAQENAWRQVFPLAQLLMCLWHYARAVFLKAREIGLFPLMEQSEDLDKIVRCCASLPLLPQHMIFQGLVDVGNWTRELGFMNDPRVVRFFQYLNAEWMQHLHRLSVFGSADRTNNVSESANRMLNAEVRIVHPSIWELLAAFVRLEDQAIVDLHTLADGREASRSRRTSTLWNDLRIRNLSRDLADGRIGIVHFLRTVQYNLQAPYNYVFN